MDARQVLSHDPQSEQLGAGEQRHNGSEERETRHGRALQEVSHQDITEHAEPEQGESKSDQARDLQRLGAEASHHVEGMGDKLAEGVSRGPLGALLVAHGCGGKAIGAPGQQYVDRDKRSFVVAERVRNLGAKGPEGAHLAGNFGTHHVLQG